MKTLLVVLLASLAVVALPASAEAHSERCAIGDVVCFARCEVRHAEAPFEHHGCYFMG